MRVRGKKGGARLVKHVSLKVKMKRKKRREERKGRERYPAVRGSSSCW